MEIVHIYKIIDIIKRIIDVLDNLVLYFRYLIRKCMTQIPAIKEILEQTTREHDIQREAVMRWI